MPPDQTPLAPARPTKPVFGKNALTVISVIAACVLAFLCLIAFAVAKTGIIDVPFFSRFYHGPEPVRVVTPEPMTADAFRVLVSSRLLAMAAEGKQAPYTVRVTENEMTGGLKAVIDLALRDEIWKASDVQLAVTKDYLELTGKFRRNNIHVDMRVRFIPIIETNGVRFEPIDVRFGDYPVDPGAARYVAGLILSRDLGTWLMTFGEATLQRVILRDGAVDVIAYPTV